jgi:hypothetical protein
LHIFEITTPGTWLDYPDSDWAWKIQGILTNLKNVFFEANEALNLFEEAAAKQERSIAKRCAGEEALRDSNRRSQILREVEAEFGFDPSQDSWGEIHYQVEVRFKREKWSKGHVPRELEMNAVFICARAFVYALDSFDKFLAVLAKEAGVPPRVSQLSDNVSKLFPHLRGVRNTSHHLEDRSRGLGTGKKPMVLQPVVNNLVDAPGGGVLVLNGLEGNLFGCTMSDGHYGKVEISHASVLSMSEVLQEVLKCFNWKGPAQHAPST